MCVFGHWDTLWLHHGFVNENGSVIWALRIIPGTDHAQPTGRLNLQSALMQSESACHVQMLRKEVGADEGEKIDTKLLLGRLAATLECQINAASTRGSIDVRQVVVRHSMMRCVVADGVDITSRETTRDHKSRRATIGWV